MMDGTQQQPSVGERGERIRRLASERFRREPDWVSFYREVLGVKGVIDRMFPTFEERNAFEQTEQFAEIQRMLAKLRERNRIQRKPDEATKVITVRLPESLHDALRNEAHNYRTSMNKLCISKLLQVVDDELVPSDLDRPDGRAASPQPAPAPVQQSAPQRPVGQSPQPVPRPQPSAPSSFPQSPPLLGGGRPF